MRRLTGTWATLLMVCLGSPMRAVAEEAWPWESAAFSWDGKAGIEALARLSKREPPKRPTETKEPTDEDEVDTTPPIDALLQETRLTVDARGREVRTERKVYWIQSERGAGYGNSVSADWHPWHQQR